MRTVLLSLAIAAVALSLATGAFAQASANANATATIASTIGITKTADMNFGKMLAGTGGTVVLSTASGRTATGGVVLVAGTPAVTAAAFTVTGEPNATYNVTIPTGNVTLTSGGSTMVANAFTSNPAGTAGSLNAGGTQTLMVGATLTVGNAQAVGTYSGSFDVSVAYN
jgi:hypothetical protein